VSTKKPKSPVLMELSSRQPDIKAGGTGFDLMTKIGPIYWFVALAIVLPQPVSARITPTEYRDVGITISPNAAAPLAAIVTDENGRQYGLAELISRPTVLVFADYSCRTLCGPIIAFVAEALRQSGLKAGAQFQLLVVGLNPKDGPMAAATMRHNYLGEDTALNGAAKFVTADDAAIKSLTSALGYRYRYDADDDQYIHPGAAYVLSAKGRVARVLTGIGLSGVDIRLALIEASEGRVGTLRDRVRLLCSHFDPVHGAYDVMVSRMLAATGLATTLALGGGIGILMLMGRRRST
jgi:protein SCO1/2